MYLYKKYNKKKINLRSTNLVHLAPVTFTFLNRKSSCWSGNETVILDSTAGSIGFIPKCWESMRKKKVRNPRRRQFTSVAKHGGNGKGGADAV